jgi:hypothetical protein
MEKNEVNKLKRCITVLFIIISIIAILNGCQTKASNEIADSSEKNSETKIIWETMNDPRLNTSWTKINEFNVDLDMDLKEDYLGLYTTAERDKQGTLMWDDGQNWLLLVQSGDKFYPLYFEYVQLGSVYFTVSKYSEDTTTIVTAIVPTGSNLKLINYKYDKDKQGFVEESIYNSEEDNFIFTSIPDYR